MKNKIAIIGLGYVGLPLAHAFSSKYEVVGFDIAQWRIDELSLGHDRTLELSDKQVKEAISNGILFSNLLEDINDCNIYIVTVPTPIDKHKKPDLTPLLKASETIGSVLKKDDIVIYESTVYPGATEEDCVPILEKVSGLKFNKDFFCGYSPERINPGDKEHTVTKILKVTSGSNPQIGKKVDELYASIITAGTHLAPSIKVAEAAKVIENSQRDINIAFVNELSMIFNRLNIDTNAVLEAAGTKWNFLNFKPGLVGGHCQIGKETIVVKDSNGVRVSTLKDVIDDLDTKKEINYHGTTLKFAKDDYEVLSFNPFKEETSFEKVKVFTKRDYNSLIKIKTSMGRSITVSDKHPMIVKDNDQYSVKLANELTIKDEIPVITKLPTLYKNESINLIDLLKDSDLNIRVKIKDEKWSDYPKFISKKYLGVKVSNYNYWDYLPLDKYMLIRDKLNIDEKKILLVTGRGPSFSQLPAIFNIDKKFARFIGYYLSEGCMTENDSIRVRITINKDEKELLADILHIIDSWSMAYSIYDDKQFNARTIKISNRPFGLMLKELKVGKDSYDASIPDKILFNSDDIRWELIKGLFRGDGGFSLPAKLSYFTISKTMFEQIMLLLHNFTIFPFLYKQEGLIEISALKELQKFKDVFLDDKKQKLDIALKSISRSVKSKNFYRSDDFFIVNIKDIKEERQNRAIYSMEVANTSNYITTSGIMTHNCIGVDPYYLTHKAQEVGYNPEIILAGRRLNDNMGIYVANQVIKLMIKKGKKIEGAKVLVLGITFKENCPDIRNSRVIDVIRELQDFGCDISVSDYWADEDEVKREYGLDLMKYSNKDIKNYDAVVLAVAHKNYKSLEFNNDNQVVFDIKSVLSDSDGKL
jgi:UDP-N-acetyl-D-mannosaminuronate dehydrogenase